MRFLLAAPLAALLAAPALAQTPAATADPALVQRYQATITPEELAGHLYLYASDYFAGRDTGAPGQRLASLYLASQYRQMGIAPRGTAVDTTRYGLGGYMQPFALERTTTRRFAVTVARGGETVVQSVIAPGSDAPVAFVPVGGEPRPGALPLLDAGHAADVVAAMPAGVRGAAVLVRPGSAANPADQAATQAALAALGEAGAAAVVLPFAPAASGLARMAARALRTGLRLPDADARAGQPLLLLTGQDVADQLVAAGLDGLALTVDADRTTETVMTENVLAFVPGSDLADEVVVVSAHLDHVGTDAEHAPGADAIYNGADDDGSGTVSILEIAEAFEAARRDGHGPRRSVLFLHVTGEEKGLLGSAYYADREPVVPLAQTVANLNIDMVGRYDPERGFDTTDYVYIIGGDLISQDLHDWNAAVNTATGTGLLLSDRFNSPDDPNQFFRRSDHWNFGKHQIPFIFYFTGTHEDYHQPGDEPHKIDYDRMARIARLIFGTAWEVANQDARPAVSGTGFN